LSEAFLFCILSFSILFSLNLALLRYITVPLLTILMTSMVMFNARPTVTIKKKKKALYHLFYKVADFGGGLWK